MNSRKNMCLIFISLMLSHYPLTSCLAATPNTKVYKVINADGSITFSDVAQTNAEEITIQTISTIPAFVVKKEYIAPSKEEVTDSNYYKSLEITHPKTDSAFYSGGGKVVITLSVTPNLRDDDQLQYQLDGVTISTQKELQHTISVINRGTHQIKASVISHTGKPLISTENTFTVHRPGKH